MEFENDMNTDDKTLENITDTSACVLIIDTDEILENIEVETLVENPTKKTRIRAKKYPEGILQHKKDIGHNKKYYDSHSLVSRCELCGSPVLIRCLSRHKKSKKCSKYMFEAQMPDS